MGFKLFKKAANFIGDLGKGVAKFAVAPVESVTGRDWDPGYKTKAGEFIGKVTDKGTKAVHIVGKAAGDTFTGGAATKLANKFRKEGFKEKAYQYNESKNLGQNLTGVKAIDKGFSVIGKASIAVGMAIGAKTIASSAESVKEQLQEKSPVSFGPVSQPETKSGAGIAAAAIAAAVLLR